MSDLDKAIKEMDLHYFATGQHGVSLAMAAACLEKPGTCLFLDVRTAEEARYAGFGNVLHIPLNELPDRMGEIPRNLPVIVFCTSVVRASMAVFYLKADGISSARTLLANSEEMVRLFSPGDMLRRQNPVEQSGLNCCI